MFPPFGGICTLNIRLSQIIALYINEYNISSASIKMTIQAGQNERLTNAVRYVVGWDVFRNIYLNQVIPPIGFRILYFLTRVSNALLSNLPNPPAKIIHTFRAFPQVVDIKNPINFDLGVELGKTTFPFGIITVKFILKRLGLTFLLPIFVLYLVKEKEDKILIMMRMSGLSTFSYFLSNYFHFLFLQTICSYIPLIVS